MFLRATVRNRDGKELIYFGGGGERAFADGRVVQQRVLYLGESYHS